jgi:hypothetical protein
MFSTIMKLAAFAAVTALAAFHSLISCPELFELNRHIRPFLLNKHPIFITHGKRSLPNKNWETFHTEEIGSVFVYDFQKLKIDLAYLAYLTGRQEQFNTTGRQYGLLIWTRFPSFIHLFPHHTNEEVYQCQFRFLHNSGLGFLTRPRITSLIITLEHLTVHQKNDADSFWTSAYKRRVEVLVDYYGFVLYLKREGTQIFQMSSVSVLKLCTGCFPAFKVSWVHFESCKKPPTKTGNMQFNCIASTLQAVSETNLNFSRFGIELESYDIEGRQTIRNCVSQTTLKNDIPLPFSNNFKNISVQNILLGELVRGLPVLHHCVWKERRDLIVINLRFSTQSNQHVVWHDFQASSSLQNQEAFNFLSCDGVRQKVDLMGYLEPLDAKIWLGTIISLLTYSTAVAILVSQSSNTSFIDSCLSSFLMNLSYLAGVANVPCKLTINNRINTLRILMLSWGIATIVLCSLYSCLVTTNVVAPKSLVSPWTEYKQLEKFTKVFGLNNQRQKLEMDKVSNRDKSDPVNRHNFAVGSKVSGFWFAEKWMNLFAKYKPTGSCNIIFGNSSTCQTCRKKSFEFIDTYTYAVRSDVQKLKEILPVCTNTAFIDTEISIDNVLHIWNQDEHLPLMVKGSPFFQQSHSWTMSNTWLFRKLLSSRLKGFTTSGIIGFWERFCLKHCKKPPELSELENSATNLKTITFKTQKLGSNISSLFLILLIAFAISILLFLRGTFLLAYK